MARPEELEEEEEVAEHKAKAIFLDALKRLEAARKYIHQSDNKEHYCCNVQQS
jgi:hypothetical protein